MSNNNLNSSPQIFYIIYKTINLLNNKIYIGQHVTSNLDDGYLGSGIAITKAISMHGRNNFKREILYFCESKEELNESKLPNLIFQKDIEQWNKHDYKNVIAFKDWESFCDWTYALHGLIKFYIHMGQMSREDCFNIFFKSYTIDNITDLNKECCNFIREIYWDEILDCAKKGYYIMYFTTQRECHDKNHFISYMLDNWLYSRIMRGHKRSETDEIKDIEFIVLNGK